MDIPRDTTIILQPRARPINAFDYEPVLGFYGTNVGFQCMRIGLVGHSFGIRKENYW